MPLDGCAPVPVAAAVHRFRKALWHKLFGGLSRDRRAPILLTDDILEQPANPATWAAIQGVADNNAEKYEGAFWYIPRSNALPQIQPKEAEDKEDKDPPGASLWPVWHYETYMHPKEGGHLMYRMPFEPLFWRNADRFDIGHTWQMAPDQRALALESGPKNIEGFITALPVRWTRRENNDTPMNLTLLAGKSPNTPTDRAIAQAPTTDGSNKNPQPA